MPSNAARVSPENATAVLPSPASNTREDLMVAGEAEGKRGGVLDGDRDGVGVPDGCAMKAASGLKALSISAALAKPAVSARPDAASAEIREPSLKAVSTSKSIDDDSSPARLRRRRARMRASVKVKVNLYL